ncbi:MAG: CoA ester lyase [Pseudomonadota bacterium]
MRSWLFVPGDSARKIDKGLASEADIVILDLEDSVAPGQKPAARALVAERLLGRTRPVAVRVNAFGEGLEDDLAAVMPAKPDIIVLPKSEAGRDVGALAAQLSVHEAQANAPDGATKILAIATETAGSLFGLGTYAGASARLIAMAWGMEDLSAALHATRTRGADGAIAPPFALARNLCLAGAHSAACAPIDTVHTVLDDDAGLKAEADMAAADGFFGKLAIHPRQVATINAAFTPSAEAVAKAKAIVDAFAAAPDAGVLSLDGEMIDRPHLTRATALLARLSR